MDKKDYSEQIGKLNLKIAETNKELEKLELEYKRKKLELKKYKNERIGLGIKFEEIELECKNKKKITEKEIKKKQKEIIRKYCNDLENEYYSQEKRYSKTDESYINYMCKNVIPYNN